MLTGQIFGVTALANRQDVITINKTSQAHIKPVHKVGSTRRYGVVVFAGLALTIGCLLLGGYAVISLFSIDHVTLNSSSGFTHLATALKSAFVQAVLSTFTSMVVGLACAISLARHANWRLVRLLIHLASFAMVVPTTVAAIGILAVWGRHGIMSGLSEGVSNIWPNAELWQPEIYGLHGVVLAHVFFNAPLVMRVFLPLLMAIPNSHWRLARQFRLSTFQEFRFIEWLTIRPHLGGISLLVFLLCFTSFSLILMLGGGPKVTTLEVEIYSAIRFDFDLITAAALSLIQIFISFVLVSLVSQFDLQGQSLPLGNRLANLAMRPNGTIGQKCYDGLIIGSLFLLTVVPLLVILIKGVSPALVSVLKWSSFWNAALNSLMLAMLSAGFAVAFGLVIAETRVRLRQAGTKLIIMIDAGIMLYLIIPPITLGTAAFLTFRNIGNIYSTAWALVFATNILLALPFVVRLLEARLASLLTRHDRLATMLNISGFARWRLLTFAGLQSQIGLALGIAAAFSLGDLTVIALFATQDFQTLPWLLYQTSGRYAADEAASLAALLLVATALLLGGSIIFIKFITRLMLPRARHA